MKIIVIGSGLFGSIAAALARRAGHDVIIIDNHSPWAASPCSGNLTKPTWLDSLGKEKAAEAYGVLRQLYQVQDVDCVAQVYNLPLIQKHETLHWVDPAQVLLRPDIVDTVTAVGDGMVLTANSGRFKGAVLVAAGVACDSLVAMPPIKRMMGSSLRIKGQVAQTRVYVWRPYTHAVAININSKEIWMGNSTAILDKNWVEAERVTELKAHARKFFKLNPDRAEVRVGARPYMDGHKQGFFAQCAPKTWVSTGGAKNGLVLAAYQAKQFVEAL